MTDLQSARLRLCTSLVLFIAVSVEAAAATGASSGASSARPHFDVFEYRVVGNTVLESRDIESAVYPFLGNGKSLQDVEAARVALETLYRERGYPSVLVDIPEQDVNEAVVRLRVSESTIGRVTVTGARYTSASAVQAAVPSAAPGTVLHVPTFQQEIQDLNSTSRDRRVAPVLRAGGEPGTVDLDLRVEDRLALHGMLEASNRYTPNTSESRVGATLSYDNVAQRQDSLGLTYQTAPEDPEETTLLSLAYTSRLGPGNLVTLYALKSDSDVAAVGTLGVLGDGRVFGARNIRQLAARGNWSQGVACGVDYKDFTDTVKLAPASGTTSVAPAVTVETPVDYLNWVCQYNAGSSLGWLGNPTRLSLSTNFGLRGLVNDSQDFAVKRYRARANYLAFDGSLGYEVPLARNWTLYGYGEGQYAAEPLLNYEQFAQGGAETVRGYAEAQQLGDYGYRLTAELRSPNFGPKLAELLDQFQVFAFVDYSEMYLRDPLPEQQSAFELGGTGLGLRLSAWKRLSADVAWAIALHDNGEVRADDSRWHLLVRLGL